MSDREKEPLDQTAETESVEVQELDEKGLEKASGGGSVGNEAEQGFQPVDDINQFQCYC